MNRLINEHLTAIDLPIPNGMLKQSCLTAALREVRGWTNRNKETGLPNEVGSIGYLGHWLGATGYMTILDQIGKTYKIVNPVITTHPVYNNSIKNALKYFTDLTPRDVKAIVALRNAFTHDFSLFNIDLDNANNNFCFSVINNPIEPVVKHTSQENKWNGDINAISPNHITTINLKTFGDLVENIYLKLIELNEADNLEIILNGKEVELEKRYFYYHFPEH